MFIFQPRDLKRQENITYACIPNIHIRDWVNMSAEYMKGEKKEKKESSIQKTGKITDSKNKIEGLVAWLHG